MSNDTQPGQQPDRQSHQQPGQQPIKQTDQQPGRQPGYKKLPEDFYLNNDVVSTARSLLGCRLWTRINDTVTAGIIAETEAYDGLTDRASHAYGGRRTPRTEIFYHAGGVAYTYLCYGIHTLFNVITGEKDMPGAILIRAVAPCEGIGTILERRRQAQLSRNTSGGPGLVTRALGITMSHNGTSLNRDTIWITEAIADEIPAADDVLAGPRVGVGYAGEDAALPWRFRIRNSPFTSPAK